MTEHIIETYGGSGFYRAECSCGWVTRGDKEEVAEECAEHKGSA